MPLIPDDPTLELARLYAELAEALGAAGLRRLPREEARLAAIVHQIRKIRRD
jgi:hypothetical protein